MNDEEIENFIRSDQCKNSLDIDGNMVSFHFNKNRNYINNEKLLSKTRFEEFDSETILKELFDNLIFINNYEYSINGLIESCKEKYISEYIEFYPCIDKLKNLIINYLLKHGLYDHEQNIINFIEEKADNIELKFFQYYIVCCGGFNNLVHNFKDIDMHEFHGINFYKYKGLSYESKEIDIYGRDDMNNEIIEIVKKLLPTDTEKANLEKFHRKVENIILRTWPNKGLSVHLFGSSVNGLWSNKSDIDLCIFADKNGEYNNVRKLAQVLRKGKMTNVIPIERARIPICKFNDPETKFNCDLSVNNRIPISNSELIRCYMDLDDRVRDIIMIIKKWSKCRGINNSKERTFCSYTYVLLCISFFQKIDPPILPNLQKINAFPEIKMVKKTVDVSNRLINKNGYGTFKLTIQYYNNAKEISRYFKSKNEMTRYELLIRLFRFYGCQFDYKNKSLASCIRSEEGFSTNCSQYNTEFAVEDPFISGRNTTSNSTLEEKTHIINEFFRAY
eukprot:jgi/Orpsp1_1/1178152/evm.model.c7180000064233.1